MKIRVGARASPLSQAQCEEVLQELHISYPEISFEYILIETYGDRDRKTSLRSLDKTDFFTREIDQLLLLGQVRIAIHAAKDLPDPLPKGLSIVALTQGLDPRDSLVLTEGTSLSALPFGARIATSSARREEAVRSLRSDLSFVDIRGGVDERLAVLRRREIDGVVVAEAALIRLALTHLNRILLPGKTAPLQGRLAVVAKTGDREMERLFLCIQKKEPLLSEGRWD